MNKTLLIIIVVIVVAALVVGGWFIWKEWQKTPEEKAADAIGKSIRAATGATLPTITTETNPLAKTPDLNPVDKVNPFKGVITNPFD